jgi:hypothetical protein
VLSITRITSPVSSEDIAEPFQRKLLPELRVQGSSSGAFVDQDTGETVILEWMPDPVTSGRLDFDLFRGFQFDSDRHLYAPLMAPAFIGLPAPQNNEICDLQYNGHEFRSRAKRCPAGHTFDARHDFKNCTVDGKSLT